VTVLHCIWHHSSRKINYKELLVWVLDKNNKQCFVLDRHSVSVCGIVRYLCHRLRYKRYTTRKCSSKSSSKLTCFWLLFWKKKIIIIMKCRNSPQQIKVWRGGRIVVAFCRLFRPHSARSACCMRLTSSPGRDARGLMVVCWSTCPGLEHY